MTSSNSPSHSDSKTKSCSSCSDTNCPSKQQMPEETAEEFFQRQKIAANLCQIRHVFVVLSGKGGVGKSTVAVNLALTLATNGLHVGVLDVDFHGPSIPRLLGLTNSRALTKGDAIEPVSMTSSIKVMSIAFFLGSENDAVIWRGPMKAGIIRQLLADVNWGELDAMVVDCPPGTGDEPLSIIQTIGRIDGVIIVTTPQNVATDDVRRSISFCRQLKMPVLGVIENMAGFVCPHCQKSTDIFRAGGGEAMAADMGVPFLGSIPLDPEMVMAGDEGKPFVQTHSKRPSALAFQQAFAPLVELACKPRSNKG